MEMSMENDEEALIGVRFLKAISSEALHAGKIVIPKHFGTKWLSSLDSPSHMTLHGSNGGKWKVKVIGVNDEKVIGKGFSIFAEDTSLQSGDVVLFKYIGGGNWKVTLFRNESETSFRNTPGSRNRQTPVGNKSLPYSGGPGSRRVVKPVNSSSSVVEVHPSGPNSCNVEETSGAPSFVKVLKPSSVIQKLGLPVHFTNKYFKGVSKGTTVTLIREGKFREVTLGGSKQYYVFTSGWVEFVKDCKLQVGQRCVFTLEVTGGRLYMEVNVVD